MSPTVTSRRESCFFSRPQSFVESQCLGPATNLEYPLQMIAQNGITSTSEIECSTVTSRSALCFFSPRWRSGSRPHKDIEDLICADIGRIPILGRFMMRYENMTSQAHDRSYERRRQRHVAFRRLHLGLLIDGRTYHERWVLPFDSPEDRLHPFP